MDDRQMILKSHQEILTNEYVRNEVMNRCDRLVLKDMIWTYIYYFHHEPSPGIIQECYTAI